MCVCVFIYTYIHTLSFFRFLFCFVLLCFVIYCKTAAVAEEVSANFAVFHSQKSNLCDSVSHQNTLFQYQVDLLAEAKDINIYIYVCVYMCVCI